MRQLPLARSLLAAVTGYNRPFKTLHDAAAAISGYEGDGHADAGYMAWTSVQSETLRPGDYAALFHIQPLLPQIRTVFDLGGNVGNIFYCFSKYLKFPRELNWMVYDLPKTREVGEQLAGERRERRLRFATHLSDADGVDLLLVSGSLHYFERPLPDMISRLGRKPRYVLINRSPLVDGPAFAAVQDGGAYRLACVIHSRTELIRGLENMDYELVDSWPCPEGSLVIPCYPDQSIRSYSGMFFRLRDNDDIRTEGSCSYQRFIEDHVVSAECGTTVERVTLGYDEDTEGDALTAARWSGPALLPATARPDPRS
jgi:putative methyltransferase (TIGR04325 family)